MTTLYIRGDNTMNKEYKQGWRYIVWVGGVDDYYKDYDRALEHYQEWIDKGYDNVVIEKIKGCIA